MLASETRKLARESLTGKWGKVALITLIFFIITLGINAVLGFIPFVGGIIQLLLQIPLAFGFTATLIKLKRGEDVGYVDFFSTGLNQFKNSWLVTIWTTIKLIVPLIVMAVFYVIIFVGLFTALQSSSYASVVSSSSTLTTEQLTFYIQRIPADQFSPTASLLIVVGTIGLIASSIWCAIKSYFYKPVMFVLFDNPEKAPKEIVEDSAKIMTGNRWKLFCLELSFIGWIILASFTFGIGFLFVAPYAIIADICFYEFLVGKKSESVVEEEVKEEVKED